MGRVKTCNAWFKLQRISRVRSFHCHRTNSPETGLGVIYRCKEILGLQRFSVANHQLLASPDRIRKLKYAVVDAGLMEPQFFSPSEMDGIVLQDRQIASYAVPGLLVALVAEGNVVFALTRMWEAFIQGIGWETKIFPSMAEAQDWIRTRVKEKFQLELS